MAIPPERQGFRPWTVFAIVAAAVLFVASIAVGGFLYVTVPNPRVEDARRVVLDYLAALARGDADAALSYAHDRPAATTFLTDEVLARQNATWPISEVRIVDDNPLFSDEVLIRVSAKFGTQTSNTWIKVYNRAKTWKLAHAAVKLDFDKHLENDGAAVRTLSLFGRPLGEPGDVYVFPGWLNFASTNQNLTANTPVLLDDLTGYAAAVRPFLDYDVSEAGKKAITERLTAMLTDCAASTSPSPLNCPNRVDGEDLVADSARWTPPRNIAVSSITGLKANNLTMSLYSLVVFGVSARYSDGETVDTTLETDVYAAADLTTSPPTVTFEI